MGPPDRCEHAARIINDLLQSLRVSDVVCAEWAGKWEGRLVACINHPISSLPCRVVPQALQGVLVCPQEAEVEVGAKATGALQVGR